MSKKICPMETEVMKGIGEEKMRPELKEHLARCPVCKDIALVQVWMNRFKEKAWKADMSKKDLPDARAVWNRVFARKSADKQMVHKALRPLIVPQVLSFVVFIGGGIFLKYHGGPSGVIVASLVMDKNLKQVLMEDQTLSWEKGERVNRLAALLRGRGIQVKELNRVELSAPYVPCKDSSRDLFAPKEILLIRIDKGVAYLEVVVEKAGQD